MRESLGAFAALLLGLLAPPALLPVPCLRVLLAALVTPPARDGGSPPLGSLGLPGDYTPLTGGEP